MGFVWFTDKIVDEQIVAQLFRHLSPLSLSGETNGTCTNIPVSAARSSKIVQKIHNNQPSRAKSENSRRLCGYNA